MAINDSAVVPLYQQVKDDIRAAIESGKYKTNEKNCQLYGDLQGVRHGAGRPAAEPSDRAGA